MLIEQLYGYFTTVALNILVEVIPFEGNIASGKTTLLTVLEKLGMKVLYEPIAEWTNVKGMGVDALALYYACFGESAEMKNSMEKLSKELQTVQSSLSTVSIAADGLSKASKDLAKENPHSAELSLNSDAKSITEELQLLEKRFKGIRELFEKISDKEVDKIIARLRAYQFQNLVYSTRSNQIINVCHDREWLNQPYKYTRVEKIDGVEYQVRTVLTERGNDSTEHIFGQRLLDQGIFNKEEMAFLNVVFDIKRTHPLERTIFLATTPDTCVTRKEKRAREQEKGSFKALIDDLDKYYRNWLKRVHHVYYVTEFELNDKEFMAEQVIEWATRRPRERVERTSSREASFTLLQDTEGATPSSR